MLNWIPLLAGAAVLTSAGAAMAGPVSDRPSIPTDALGLEHVLARGCAPFLLGQESEKDAMRAAGLSRVHPLPISLDPGGDAPYWTGGFPETVRVNAGAGVCNVVLHGRNEAAYRAAAQAAIDEALAPASADDARSRYRQWVPGQVTGCRRNVRFTYYQGRKVFSVELTRVDCAHDPLRETG